MNKAETNAQISKILSDLKNCQENLLNETLIISEEPRILDERVLPTYDVDGRKQVARKSGFCLLCLDYGQVSKQCQNDVQCSFCQGRHHTLFCYKKWKYEQEDGDPDQEGISQERFEY